VLHRTLIQTGEYPGDAPAALGRLLSQLDLVSAAGIITTTREPAGPPDANRMDEQVVGAGRVRLRFVPFSSPAPGHHTGAEYLRTVRADPYGLTAQRVRGALLPDL
jgi:hypothetical protein